MEGKEEEEKKEEEKKSNFQKHRVKLVLKKCILETQQINTDFYLQNTDRFQVLQIQTFFCNHHQKMVFWNTYHKLVMLK